MCLVCLLWNCLSLLLNLKTPTWLLNSSSRASELVLTVWFIEKRDVSEFIAMFLLTWSCCRCLCFLFVLFLFVCVVCIHVYMYFIVPNGNISNSVHFYFQQLFTIQLCFVVAHVHFDICSCCIHWQLHSLFQFADLENKYMCLMLLYINCLCTLIGLLTMLGNCSIHHELFFSVVFHFCCCCSWVF